MPIRYALKRPPPEEVACEVMEARIKLLREQLRKAAGLISEFVFVSELVLSEEDHAHGLVKLRELRDTARGLLGREILR